MKNKALLVFLIFFCTVAVFSRGNPWGSLKKIYFYDSTQKYSKVAEELQAINFAEINRGDRKEIAQHLIKFGDYYFSKKKKDLAEARSWLIERRTCQYMPPVPSNRLAL